MDVVDWRDTPRPVVVSRNRTTRNSGSPTLIGVIGTVLLHAVIVPTAYFESRGARPHIPEIPTAGVSPLSKDDPRDNLVLVTLAIPNSSQAIAIGFTPQIQLNQKLRVVPARLEPVLPVVDILALEEDESSPSAGEGADSTEQARLFGIYSGQIRARIERLWRRPRTPVDDTVGAERGRAASASFRCQVQIVQDESGRVQEVLLPQCNGSAAWRRSLVMAIQQASPLPAPPSARVFSRSIAMGFVGVSYDSDSNAQDYETEASPSARVSEQRLPSVVFDEFRTDTHAGNQAGVLNRASSRKDPDAKGLRTQGSGYLN